ncbi:hypothetical protein, partial [Salmonella enterica]|uniref:hypothetical protein n=1 Tax=Salmonella enterica TaxID=28901 RepID=UPI00398C3EB7
MRALGLSVRCVRPKNTAVDGDFGALFDCNALHMGPWDVPAGIVTSDRRFAACNLDRTGLRPARYVITNDKLLTFASDVGIRDYQQDEVLEKCRVRPRDLMGTHTRLQRFLHTPATDADHNAPPPANEL